MYSRIKQIISCLPQQHRIGVMLCGIALIFLLSWFCIATHIYQNSMEMLSSHAESREHINAANDLFNSTERMVYENQLSSIDDVTHMLQRKISGRKKLQLVSVVKHAPVNLSESDFSSNVLVNAEGMNKPLLASLYAYDATIELVGDYFNFLDYLQAIKAQNTNRFYWIKVDYKVIDYPTAEITMVIRTINYSDDDNNEIEG